MRAKRECQGLHPPARDLLSLSWGRAERERGRDPDPKGSDQVRILGGLVGARVAVCGAREGRTRRGLGRSRARGPNLGPSSLPRSLVGRRWAFTVYSSSFLGGGLVGNKPVVE